MKQHITIFVFVVITLALAVVFDQIYWTGFNNGIQRAEQCLTNGGKIKADYEEHFICLY